MDNQGNLIKFDNKTKEIFAIDSSDNWEALNIFQIDKILATGISENLDNIVNQRIDFKRNNISCTNRFGKFYNLNILCKNYNDHQDSENIIIGFVEDISQKKITNEVTDCNGLQILSEVASALSSANELEQILNVILTSATASQGLSFNRAFLMMYDADSKILKGHLAVGPSSAEEAGNIWNELESMRLSLPELFENDYKPKDYSNKKLTALIKNLNIDLNRKSLIKDACLNKEWINLGEINNYDDITRELTEILDTNKIAIVPMVSKNKLTGLLVADNYITGEEISDSSIQLLQILANQGAVALERANLYREQIEKTKQLEKMNRLIEESQEQMIKIEKMSVIGELTASIAHELRNPLTIVGGFAGLMLKDSNNDDQREYLNIISSEIKRAEEVLSDVLDFHKASKNESKNILFNKFVSNTLDLVLSRQKQTGIKLPLSLDSQKPLIYGNYDQLSHAFYQCFRLIVEDLMPMAKAEARIEQKDNTASLIIRLTANEENRKYILKTLKQIFSESKASLRLTILVATESIKSHGGNLGLSFDKDNNPSLYIDLPLVEEKKYDS
jgi:hypothetical protein